jgi:hypothetical protein
MIVRYNTMLAGSRCRCEMACRGQTAPSTSRHPRPAADDLPRSATPAEMVLVSATADVSANGPGPYDDIVIVTGNGKYRFAFHGLDALRDGVEL